MDQFRTLVDIPVSQEKISYSSKVMMMGSCFVENMGKKLQENKFQLCQNPFGVLYNPISVVNSLEILLQEKEFTKEDLFFDQDLWNSYSHHSSFSNSDLEKCLSFINKSREEATNFLKKTDFLFITFGTSWVYELNETGKIVSNCHKQKAACFNRKRLSVEAIVNTYTKLIASLQQINPNLKIVFTLSPIRHWKDGAHANQLSKSTLLLAIDQLEQQFQAVSYFASYEIVMDELRDYRFYSEDMLHVNSVTVKYIWEKFVLTYIGTDSLSIMKRVSKLILAANHRPFNPQTDSHQKFICSTLRKIEQLEKEIPSISFQKEVVKMKKNSKNKNL